MRCKEQDRIIGIKSEVKVTTRVSGHKETDTADVGRGNFTDVMGIIVILTDLYKHDDVSVTPYRSFCF